VNFDCDDRRESLKNVCRTNIEAGFFVGQNVWHRSKNPEHFVALYATKNTGVREFLFSLYTVFSELRSGSGSSTFLDSVNV
jgi:hypothetical protein